MPSFWISFVKDVNVGCCIIEAPDHESALDTAENLRVAPPYDDAMITEMNMDSSTSQREVEKWGYNRLITPTELVADGYKKIFELDDDEQKFYEN
jgi:hypothetical protein